MADFDFEVTQWISGNDCIVYNGDGEFTKDQHGMYQLTVFRQVHLVILFQEVNG